MFSFLPQVSFDMWILYSALSLPRFLCFNCGSVLSMQGQSSKKLGNQLEHLWEMLQRMQKVMLLM